MIMKFLQSYTLMFTLILLSCKNEKDSITIEREDYHLAINKLTETLVHDIFSPPTASRSYVYPSIAAYEILNQNNETYHSLANQLNGLSALKMSVNPKDVNLKLASLIAYLDVSKDLVFSKENIIDYRDSLYVQWDYQNSEDFRTAKQYGLEMANHIIEWMNNDGYKETRSMPTYNIYSEDPSTWQPTPPAYMDGIEPHWDKLRPFILDSASQFKPKPYPKFSMKPKTLFFEEVLTVYETVKEIREKGNESQEIKIAQFWDCNPFVSVNKGHYMFAEKKITPGAHWIGITKIANNKTNANYHKTVFAHTKVSIAIADAFISCWDEKYRSNLVRPETLINEFIDPTWLPVLQTPPFPEYTSGHSVISNTSAVVLSSIYGDDFEFLDTTEIPYGLPSRFFDSFQSAADEATISRLYGGIHYESAIYEGKEQGILIGNFINDNIHFLKKSGN